MAARLPRKVRRILHALDLAGRPLTAAELSRATCHGIGTVYVALDRLEEAGWITREQADGPSTYQLTDHGRTNAGLKPVKEQS